MKCPIINREKYARQWQQRSKAPLDEVQAGYDYWLLSRGILASPVSKSGSATFKEVSDSFSHFQFVISLAHKSDHVREIAIRALHKVGADSDGKNRLEELEINPTPNADQIKKFARVSSRNLLLSAVASINNYFLSALREVCLKNSSIIKSSSQMSVEDILELNSRDEIVAHVVDRVLNELSYGGTKEIERFLDDRLKIKMFENKDRRDLFVILNELRNIHAHNGARVDRIFLKRVPKHPQFIFKLGGKFYCDFDELRALIMNAATVIKFIDDQLCRKFKIRQRVSEKVQLPRM